MPLSSTARRLFPDDEATAVEAAPSYRTARLLEDGDRAELRAFLDGDAGPAGDWLERHGARRLSRRSLAFWEWVLERKADVDPEARALRSALWPL